MRALAVWCVLIAVEFIHGALRILVLVGILWLTLPVVFELTLGHFVLERSWKGLASDYNILGGGLLLGLLCWPFRRSWPHGCAAGS